MSYPLLNNALWNQRQLLELLVFKLEVEQLLLASGKSKWLAHSTAEIERLISQLAEIELARSVESDAVATELGLAGDAPLSALVERAPEPWGELLGAHRTALLQLATEIDVLTTGARELLTSSQRAVQESLASFANDPATYDASGETQAAEAQPRLIDQDL